MRKSRPREGESHCKFVTQLGLESRSHDSSPRALCNAVPCCSLSENISLAGPWKEETVFNYGKFLSTNSKKWLHGATRALDVFTLNVKLQGVCE